MQLHSRRTKQGLWLFITFLEKNNNIIRFLLLLSYVGISSLISFSIFYLFTFSIFDGLLYYFFLFSAFYSFLCFFLFFYFLLSLFPTLMICDVTLNILYVLFIAIVIGINFSLSLFILPKKMSIGSRNLASINI